MICYFDFDFDVNFVSIGTPLIKSIIKCNGGLKKPENKDKATILCVTLS